VTTITDKKQILRNKNFKCWHSSSTQSHVNVVRVKCFCSCLFYFSLNPLPLSFSHTLYIIFFSSFTSSLSLPFYKFSTFFIALMLYLLLFSQFVHLCDILIFSLLFNFLPFLTKYSNLLLILLPQYFEHSKNARAKKKHRKPEPQLTKFLLIKNELQFWWKN
jgi:hypothetical protein